MLNYFKYVKESFHLLYLIFFQPSLFIEVEKTKIKEGCERDAIYTAFKALPAAILTFFCIAALTGFFVNYCNYECDWTYPFIVAVASGIAIAVTTAIIVSIAANRTWGIIAGTAWGILTTITVGSAWYLAVIIAWGISGNIAAGIAAGITVGTIASVARGTTEGITIGSTINPTAGITWGIIASIITIISGGLTTSIAAGESERIILGIALAMAAGIAAGIAVEIKSGFAGDMTTGIAAGITASAIAASVLGITAGIATGIAFIFSYFRLIFYILYFPIILFLYYRAHKNPDDAYYLFKKTPLFFDEIIPLPLFLTDKFLVLVGRHDRGKVLSEIRFISTKRPLQISFARKALVELTFQDLMKAKTLNEISEASNTLEWLPDNQGLFYEGSASALRMINEISNDADHYVTSTSNYTRLKVINILRENIENLGKTAVNTRGIIGIKSAELSEIWLEIINLELQKFHEDETEYKEIPNPYIFGTPIEEEYKEVFVGRDDVAEIIEDAFFQSLMGRGPNFLIYGERRMGKTSVLKHLPGLLGDKYIPVFVDMQQAKMRESINTFLYNLAKAILNNLDKRRIKVNINTLTLAKFFKNPYTAFSEWMDEVEQKVKEQNKFIILCLDEYEAIEKSIDSGNFTTDIMDEIRGIIQNRDRFVIILGGSHNIGELKYNWSSYLISVKTIKISYLALKDAVKLITNPIEDFDLNYKPGAVEKIIDATNCHPFLVQAVCSELVNYLNSSKRKEATTDDVDIAVKKTILAAENYFRSIWNSFSDDEKEILMSLASGESKMSNKSGSEPGKLKKLIDREILKCDDEGCYFQVNMLKWWILRQ